MVNVQPTAFNPAQLYAELDRLWDEGILDQKRLDEINEMDLHQWLREQKEKEKNKV